MTAAGGARTRLTDWTPFRDAGTLRLSLRLSVVQGDILEVDADVVAFKYAQALHGADRAAVQRLLDAGVPEASGIELAPGAHRFVATRGALRAPEALFIGTQPLGALSYASIHDFAAEVINTIANREQTVSRLAMTIHGPGFGLDETKAFLAQVGGCHDAARKLNADRRTSITFVERAPRRAERLERALADLTRPLPGYELHRESGGLGAALDVDIPRAGRDLHLTDPEVKPSAFVAMPFADEWDDVFHLGISEPIRACGYRCERVDQAHFTGDVLEQVKTRIERARIVVAELSEANANVYLEVGYAWGRGRPTSLLVRGLDEPKFDVRGQRYLRYRRIVDLRQILREELEGLRALDGA